jgi:hypothetical protein
MLAHGGYGWFNRQMLWRMHDENFVRTFGPAQDEMGMDVLHKGWELYWIHLRDQKIHSFIRYVHVDATALVLASTQSAEREGHHRMMMQPQPHPFVRNDRNTP